MPEHTPVVVRCGLCLDGEGRIITTAADSWTAAMDHALDAHRAVLIADPDTAHHALTIESPDGRRTRPLRRACTPQRVQR